MGSLITGKLGATRQLESGSGARGRAARRLRRKGFGKAAEKMALDAEELRLKEKELQGTGFRSAESEADLAALSKKKSRAERAAASGHRPSTEPATGEKLQQRLSLFEEMKAARESGKDVQGFRDRATGLGVTAKGFESAVGKLPALQTPGAGPSPTTPPATTPKTAAPAPTTGGLGFGDLGTATNPPAATPPAATPPAPTPTKLPPPRNLHGGLPTSLATSISKEYHDISSRMQRLLQTPGGKDLAEDPEAVKSLEQRLRRRTNISVRDRLLDGEELDPLSREGILLEEHYRKFPLDTTDPREVLTRLRDKQDREKYAPAAEKPAMSPEELDKLVKSARGISDAMEAFRSPYESANWGKDKLRKKGYGHSSKRSPAQEAYSVRPPGMSLEEFYKKPRPITFR